MLDVLGNVVVDGGGQRQVEETVCHRPSRQRQDVCVEFGEGAVLSIVPTYVGVPAKEGCQPVGVFICHLSQRMETYTQTQ